jgi:uncharacterized protein YqgC (DUF456 family)
MNTNGRSRPSEPSVTTSFAGLTHDVIELAELQAQLFAVDVKHTSKNAKSSLVMAVIGICTLLGSVPVALIALAELLVEKLEWTRAAGHGAATLVGLLVSIAILGAAWAQFRSGFSALQRSREELNRNIAWIKSSLRNRASANPTVKD